MEKDANTINKTSEEEERKELIVKRGDAILVPPEENTHKGTLYFLSNLDQNFNVIVSTIYCFEKFESKSNETAAKVIRDALSKILVHYYPLAGRLVVGSDGKLAVDCSGEGAVFVEAEANSTLQVVISENRVPHSSIHGKLLYNFAGANDTLGMPLVMAQVTKFKCGGFVLGLCLNHALLDGYGAMQFVNSWGEIARGLPLSVCPGHDRTIFRARNPLKIEFPHHEFSVIEDISNTYEKGEMVLRSFVFSPDKINQLKMKANNERGFLPNYSSFETLLGFVWRERTKALKLCPDQRIKLLLSVDGRSRLNPPVPEGYYGNAFAFANVLCSAGDIVDKPLSDSVGLVQEAIGMVTNKYIKSFIDYLEVTRANSSMTSTVLVTSWRRLAFNSLNFGWGTPVISGCATLPAKELILFLPHGSDGKSINVLLGLPASSMHIFEQLMQI